MQSIRSLLLTIMNEHVENLSVYQKSEFFLYLNPNPVLRISVCLNNSVRVFLDSVRVQLFSVFFSGQSSVEKLRI
jgi:hypothetical protein